MKGFRTFFVAGRPVQQGSMKVINGHVIHTSPGLKPWRELIGWRAREAKIPLLDKEQAVEIWLDFTFLKPKTVTREYPTVPLDADKLLRSVLDALSTIAYVDDAQVTDIHVTKRYGLTEGVSITVLPLQSM